MDALLKSKEIRYCEYCGIPLEYSIMSKTNEGEIDSRYCQWCFDNGSFVYQDFEQMLSFLISNMPREGMDEEESRKYYSDYLRNLPYWRNK